MQEIREFVFGVAMQNKKVESGVDNSFAAGSESNLNVHPFRVSERTAKPPTNQDQDRAWYAALETAPRLSTQGDDALLDSYWSPFSPSILQDRTQEQNCFWLMTQRGWIVYYLRKEYNNVPFPFS